MIWVAPSSHGSDDRPQGKKGNASRLVTMQRMEKNARSATVHDGKTSTRYK